MKRKSDEEEGIEDFIIYMMVKNSGCAILVLAITIFLGWFVITYMLV